MFNSVFEEVLYNPGIFGFIKAHRHICGPALVMTTWEQENRNWAAVYWVKRLHHAAIPLRMNLFKLINKKTMRAVERMYDLLMSSGPPFEAFSEIPDSQRTRVYDWEEAVIMPGFPKMGWEKCKAFFTTVWQTVGNKQEPSLTINKRLNGAIAYRDRIEMPAKQRENSWTKPVILHETAHILNFEDKHGPKFVAVYIDLCTEFLGFDRRILTTSATHYGVAY